MNNIIEMFSYTFMLRALILGTIISLCSGVLGVSLVLKKNSMIGDGLSHVAFGALAVATILSLEPLAFTIPVVIIVSFLILKINERSKINSDSLIALISSSSLAIGVLLISLKGVNTDLNAYLFGSILSSTTTDIILSIILGIVVLSLYIVAYNKIFALTFDETFAKSIGINTDFYNALLSILCSLTIVIGMRLVGSLLISSLIIFPCLSSTQIFKNYKSVIISSSIISVISFIIGLILSYTLSTAAGSTIVIVNLIIFLGFKTISLIKRG